MSSINEYVTYGMPTVYIGNIYKVSSEILGKHILHRSNEIRNAGFKNNYGYMLQNLAGIM